MATQINVKSPKTKQDATGSYNFGENLSESVKLFGEEVVHSQFVSQVTVRAAAVVRGVLDAKKTPAEALVALAAWKPGVKRAKVAVDPKAAAVAAFAEMDDKERKEFLAALKAA